MAAPTKFELMMVAARRPHGPYIAEDLIGAFGLQVIDWTDAHAELAIDAFLRFGRGRHPAALNFGDCMAYALAKALDAPLLYKGNDFSQTDITSAL